MRQMSTHTTKELREKIIRVHISWLKTKPVRVVELLRELVETMELSDAGSTAPSGAGKNGDPIILDETPSSDIEFVPRCV
jgi:hypothetical protein